MKVSQGIGLGVSALFAAVTVVCTPAAAQQPPAPQPPPQQQQQKPNVLFIMADDIGWMQPSIYHQGIMVGETPNIDRIGREGAKFMYYLTEQSCTAGRNAFFTGIASAAHGHDPAPAPR